MLDSGYKLIRFFAKVIFGSLLLLILAAGFVFLTLPNTDFLFKNNPTVSSYMLAARADGLTTQTAVDFVPLSQISPNLVRAVLVAEDDSFFSHEGFNWQGMQNAFRIDWQKHTFAHGGSTITQQLARNLFLTKEKSILRKLREAVLTYRLENSLSKARILELYLNFAEFGPGVFGVTAASQYHFNKTPRNLSAADASLLASVLPNPYKYGKKPYPHSVLSRQRMILYRMARYDLHFPENLFSRPAAEVKLAHVEPESEVPHEPPVNHPQNIPDNALSPTVAVNPIGSPAEISPPAPITPPISTSPDDDTNEIHIDDW
jgi:monofunctional biosynthetic peptidoglycan transglycosylase